MLKSSEDLIKYINIIFKSYQNGSKDPKVDKSYDTLSERVLIDKNELSANKIIKVWESIKTNKFSMSNNWVKFFIGYAMICNLKRFNSKNYN